MQLLCSHESCSEEHEASAGQIDPLKPELCDLVVLRVEDLSGV